MTDFAFFCPGCGSSAVDTQALAGTASCRACEWSGLDSLLIVAPIEHGLGSKDNIAYAVIQDLRIALAKDCAVPLGRFLLKWGFLAAADTPQGVIIDNEQLGRYMTAIQAAVYTAILAEREAIEKEQTSG